MGGRPAGSSALSTVVTGSSAAIRRAVFSDTPLSAAMSLHRVLGAPQDLNLVTFQHVDHPFLRRKPSLRQFSDPVGRTVGSQNFRKGS